MINLKWELPKSVVTTKRCESNFGFLSAFGIERVTLWLELYSNSDESVLLMLGFGNSSGVDDLEQRMSTLRNS